jgi:murein DD-endopeptidase
VSLVSIAMDVAFSQLGRPYVWGGNDPMAGFDCSGLVVEVLQSVGVLPRQGDWSADALARRFKARMVPEAELRPGWLVFWRRDDGTMRHVEMVYAVEDGRVITIGASGGGPKTRTLADAIRMDAFTKLRPIAPGWVAAVDPF